METVTIQKLSKTYPSGKEALKQLSLTLSTGEVFGFLGPNGAGKTTTVKLLTGVLSPSGGSCEIMGVNPNIQPEKVHLLAGIVTEHAQMLFTYPVAGAPDKVIALLVGMVLFVVNEANRVENQVIMQMVFIDVSCQNKLILAA